MATRSKEPRGGGQKQIATCYTMENKGWPRHFSLCKSEKHFKQREKWRGHPLEKLS